MLYNCVSFFIVGSKNNAHTCQNEQEVTQSCEPGHMASKSLVWFMEVTNNMTVVQCLADSITACVLP